MITTFLQQMVTQEMLETLCPTTTVFNSPPKIGTMINGHIHVHSRGRVVGGIRRVSKLISTVSIALINKDRTPELFAGGTGREVSSPQNFRR